MVPKLHSFSLLGLKNKMEVARIRQSPLLPNGIWFVNIFDLEIQQVIS